MEKFKVKFLPDNKTVEVEKDKTILSAAISCGLYLNSACGGEGICGKCKVVLKKGKVTTQPNGLISAGEKDKNIYLSCITTVHSDLEVEVPSGSRMDFEKLSPGELDARLRGIYVLPEEIEPVAPATPEGLFKDSPFATKLYLSLSQPTFDDRISDLERLSRHIRLKADIPKMQTGLYNLRQLGELLRDSEWKVTVTLGKRNDTVEIVLIEPGDTSSRNFGFAFDIGTTTISAQLIDLNSKKILGTKATYNKQAHFGSDVITRIVYAQQEEGLQRLHNAVADTMNEMIRELVQEHGIDLNDATCVLCAGNTTMMHLLLSIDPAHIRKEPYVPTANFLPVIRALEAGININPRGLLANVPGVASYVGGDVTAGVLSCGLYKEDDLCVLIDIGTNGEVVVGNKEFLVACAASAGPAFEGSGVACGMRSSRGAIQKVSINPGNLEVNYGTIGDAKPRGICGSGYIDLLAEMFNTGIIDKGGKIKMASGGRRIRQSEFGREFIVAFKEESDASADIVITEADIENLKRAKAAIYSATSILIKHLGLDFSQVKKIFIAGGFGSCLDVSSAVNIGLLPDLERSKFVFVGNSSLAGARSILLSYEAMKKAEDIAGKITYFELSVEPGYMDEYMAALFFPHTDLDKFPSVKL
ncbi:MAG TPA: ASKHA domain-containing protein [Candidatus Margulisiibacteriota bacterium]|nr:ASKHA domain-containing protein [Candidatus Margulisiibacteriota bacterium]